jgi:protein gp37
MRKKMSKIEWTEKTWNPVTGCSKVSPGCEHCYAERMARRLAGRCGYPPAPAHFKVTLHPERLLEPLKWRRPSRVFVCSMGDLFHEEVPDSFVFCLWAVMALYQEHTFQVLTKRPERMQRFLALLHGGSLQTEMSVHGALAWFQREKESEIVGDEVAETLLCAEVMTDLITSPQPRPNIWLGVTCEDQQRADERIPLLLQTPAAVRFVSCEPLLGPVDFRKVPGFNRVSLDLSNWWVICGAETGPRKRPMNLDWARQLRNLCHDARVPFFFKKDSQGRRELDGVRHEEYPHA